MSSPLAAHPTVTLDGVELTPERLTGLQQVVVDDDLLRPDLCTLRFADGERTTIQDLHVKFGTKVVVRATRAAGGASPEALFTGEVVTVESDRGPGGTSVVLVCYDGGHKLTRGTRTKAWVKHSDSDIARAIASAAGLSPVKVDDTGAPLDQVAQVNVSDWDFLVARAQRIGYQLTCDDGGFQFVKVSGNANAPAGSADQGGSMDGTGNRTLLVFGETLLSFYPRVTSAGQVGSVQVLGWDPKTKASITGQATVATTTSKVGVGVTELGRGYGSQTLTAVHHHVASQSEATTVAKAIADRLGSLTAEAEGVSLGDPKLTAGTAIGVTGVGWPADGSYVLTRTRHVFDERGYRTELFAGGRSDRSLLGLTSHGTARSSAGGGGQSIPGVVVGIVNSIKDPENMGRVTLTLPWLPNYITDWARVAMLGAGAARGSTFLPEVGDEVLVAFGHGDLQMPYVVGQLHNGKDKLPAEYVSGNDVKKRALVSRKGHKIVFDDDKDGIQLALADGAYLLNISKSDTTIEITSDGTVTIKGKTDVKVTGKTITLEAQSDLKLKGANVTVEASAALKMSGAQAELDGSATTTIKGGMVQIN